MTAAPGPIDLAEAALLLAALDRPGVALASYRRHLAVLADEVGAETSATDAVGTQTAALNRVIVGRHGYKGDVETYDDFRNANLIDVIDRRKGLPVAIGILYIHCVRGYGGAVDGLNFPSHFLVRIGGRGQRAILDPFNGGQALAPEDLRARLKELHGGDAELQPRFHEPVDDRDILIRLQNNIKIRAIQSGDTERALQVLEGMSWLAPGRADLCWEQALLECRAGQTDAAIATLERFLEGSGGQARHRQIENLLRHLRSRAN